MLSHRKTEDAFVLSKLSRLTMVDVPCAGKCPVFQKAEFNLDIWFIIFSSSGYFLLWSDGVEIRKTLIAITYDILHCFFLG